MASLPSIAQGTRDSWIDVTKAIAIYLIVLGHFPEVPFPLLYTFHVPVFFFISGYLFRPLPAAASLMRVQRRLLVPYVLGYILLVIFNGFEISNFDRALIQKQLWGIVYGTHSYPYFISAPLWFLPALAIVEIMYDFFVRRSHLLYITLLSISIYLYTAGVVNLILSFDLALLGLNFFLAGRIFRHYRIAESLAKLPRCTLASIFIVLSMAVYDFARQGNVWFAGPSYSRSVLGGLCGIMMLITFSMLLPKWISESSLLRKIADTTLFILMFHIVFLRRITMRLEFLHLQNIPLKIFLSTSTVLLILIPIGLLARRYFPELVGQSRSRK